MLCGSEVSTTNMVNLALESWRDKAKQTVSSRRGQVRLIIPDSFCLYTVNSEIVYRSCVFNGRGRWTTLNYLCQTRGWIWRLTVILTTWPIDALSWTMRSGVTKMFEIFSYAWDLTSTVGITTRHVLRRDVTADSSCQHHRSTTQLLIPTKATTEKT